MIDISARGTSAGLINRDETVVPTGRLKVRCAPFYWSRTPRCTRSSGLIGSASSPQSPLPRNPGEERIPALAASWVIWATSTRYHGMSSGRDQNQATRGSKPQLPNHQMHLWPDYTRGQSAGIQQLEGRRRESSREWLFKLQASR